MLLEVLIVRVKVTTTHGLIYAYINLLKALDSLLSRVLHG